MSFIMSHLVLVSILSVIAIAAGCIITALFLRKIVPTNMLHIVQSRKNRISYGKGSEHGNAYYAWPSFLPIIGVTVTEFPQSIFSVNLQDYEAYDTKRLPFLVDVVAFFRVSAPDIAAARVANFGELNSHLKNILQGAIRRILADNTLDQIMQGRSEFGAQFTAEVKADVEAWGVETVKNIELMDIRDSRDSVVINNIMAQEKSRIAKDSRIAVATNTQAAETAEIDAQRVVEVQRQYAAQQVGIRTTEKEKTVSIAKEVAQQEVKAAALITAEKDMAVKKVNAEKAAEIQKQVGIIEAEASKAKQILDADAKLQAVQKEAEGKKALGEAEAKASELMLMAPVTAQTELAEKIGANLPYQEFLIKQEQVKVSASVGIEMAKAIAAADLKVISTGGKEGEMMGGVSNLMEVFSPKGGANLTGMLATLAATKEGADIINKITGPKSA